MKMAEIEQDILNDLEELSDTISQYTYLISCAEECLPLPDAYRCEEYLVRGCQVRTWIRVDWKEGRSVLWADSESLIVKGALALFQEIYHDRTREEVSAYRCSLLEQELFKKHFSKEQLTGLESIVRILGCA